MALDITKIENQAKGYFAGGLIQENKPIGFPQDGGKQKPYSNLFYWANAWSEKGGLIPEHPHKMFEIMSFVLEGEIQHYDSKYKRWLSLQQGDAQIIRAGSGIIHAERLMENSRIFQIWFDPNIQETMNFDASYDDYKNEHFPIEEKAGVFYKRYAGNNGPVKMHSEGVEISEIVLKAGKHQITLSKNNVYSYYVLNGSANINGNSVSKHDFIKIENEDVIQLENKTEFRLFEISTPSNLSYKTYNELVKF